MEVLVVAVRLTALQIEAAEAAALEMLQMVEQEDLE
jgi:hypothetical protein